MVGNNMKSAFFTNGIKYVEVEFDNEQELEKFIKDNSRVFFGPNTIYFDIKSKIESKLYPQWPRFQFRSVMF